MEKQIAVVNLVQASRLQEELHMATELLASGEGGDEALHYVALGGREGVGVLRVDGREHFVGELVLGAVEHHRAAIGGGDHVDDANEGGLACAIRAKQTIDAAFGHTQVHMVERRVPFILLHYIADFNKSHILEISC